MHYKKQFFAKYLKVPLHLLIKWEVVSPNSRLGIFNMKLNGRWFPQIVNRAVGIYIQYILHSLVLIFDPKCVWGGGEGVKNGGCKKQIVVLASEPVGRRSRATELPCLFIIFSAVVI